MSDWTGGLIQPVVIPSNMGERRIHRIETPADGVRKKAPQAAGGEAGSKRKWERIDNPWNLSPCQCQVAQFLSEGYTNPEIGAAMGIVTKTVEQHVWNLRANMGHVSRLRVAVLWDRFIVGREARK